MGQRLSTDEAVAWGVKVMWCEVINEADGQATAIPAVATATAEGLHPSIW
jgi:hypothetical protein